MIAKRILLAVTAILAASVLALVGWHGVDNTAQAQGSSLKPANVRAVNGPNPGEAIVSWDAVPAAAYYRVGWVSLPNYEAVTAAGRDWREAFYFVDLKNTGQTSFTVSRLEPGAQHFFMVAGNNGLWGEPQWSSVARLTLNSDTTACPTPTPGGTANPTTSAPDGSQFPANPVNGDYDHDDDGLIEIRSIAQLDAIRHDLDGNGASSVGAYSTAFPGAATGMGCPDTGCVGYELAASLDFQTADGSGPWAPLGYYNSSNNYAYFTADFNGNDLTISNLHINRRASKYVGLFGLVGSGSIVRRVGLEAVNATGRDSVGGLVGYNFGNISNSYVKGSVSGEGDVGGLVGYNDGTVTQSYADANVLSRSKWDEDVGGLVGDNRGSISNSYAEGDVYGERFVGGLVGHNDGVITASYATGNVTGDNYIGGLVGSHDGVITAAYATGNTSASDIASAGLVASNYGTITAAYATGTASGNGSSGLVGNVWSEGGVYSSYWDTDTSGLYRSYGGLGKTTAQLQTPTSVVYS